MIVSPQRLECCQKPMACTVAIFLFLLVCFHVDSSFAVTEVQCGLATGVLSILLDIHMMLCYTLS